jgi:hypothetical protein
MTAPTIEAPAEHVDLKLLPCMVDSDWETPCPMTGKNHCPSDPKQQDKCPQC